VESNFKMCDHQFKKNTLQVQDGYTRYTCKLCKYEMKNDDVEFDREYIRNNEKCHHFRFFLREDVPTYKNKEGIMCCMWCGVKI
jgi:hypothetical protein